MGGIREGGHRRAVEHQPRFQGQTTSQKGTIFHSLSRDAPIDWCFSCSKMMLTYKQSAYQKTEGSSASRNKLTNFNDVGADPSPILCANVDETSTGHLQGSLSIIFHPITHSANGIDAVIRDRIQNRTINRQAGTHHGIIAPRLYKDGVFRDMMRKASIITEINVASLALTSHDLQANVSTTNHQFQILPIIKRDASVIDIAFQARTCNHPQRADLD
ncbi:MAG: hypothetical protein HQL97_02910 [Magnetococcales bacterium]|nr:hypothetical protein [Magnetococcales bacterium]